MITPGLEKLILEGSAEYKQFTVGGGAVSTIPVPTRNYIVLTDFIWFPFIDLLFLSQPPYDYQFYNTKRVQLRSLNKNVNWVFRDQFSFNWKEPFKKSNATFDPGIQYHCFHKFTEDVNVDLIITPPSISWFAPQYSGMPDISGEDLIPNGYGTTSFGTLATMKDFFMNFGGSQINVPGYKRNPDVFGQPRSTNQFLTDYNLGQELLDPTFLALQGDYPIITFGYVQVFNL